MMAIKKQDSARKRINETLDRPGLTALRQGRFEELPLDCGNDISPGVIDSEEWRDWSNLHPTADQLDIEDHLDRRDMRGKAILHIGIGNSSVARRFAARTSRIVGTTILKSELERARAEGIPNYLAVIHNKYSGDSSQVGGQFDVIIDNNPTSFCCCLKHLMAMLEFYAAKLSDDGEILTHRVGLGWQIAAAEANPRWSFDFEDLAAVAALAGLDAYRATGDIYVLSRRPPLAPSFASLARYFARRARGKAAGALRRVRKLRRQ